MYQIGANKKCLKHHESSVRLDTARSTCANMGAKLILPLTSQEDDDFFTVMQQLGTPDVAIDIKYDDQSGNWNDLSGNPITYTRWNAGQPNGNLEHYAFKKTANNGKWHDKNDSNKYKVICEKPLIGSSGEVPFIYHGEENLASVSVSSEAFEKLQNMFDGDPTTYWHSQSSHQNRINWVRVAFHAAKSIYKVEVLKREGSTTVDGRYGNMCTSLFDESSREIETKCTTAATGTPYLAEDGKTILVEFNSVNNVLMLEIVFTGDIGQIAELFVHGTHRG